MGIIGSASATQEVVVPSAVNIQLADAGEVRRLGRILLGFLDGYAGRGTRTDAFARDLIAALGYTEANTAKG